MRSAEWFASAPRAQAALRQHAQAQLEAAQQGYSAEAAAQRQLEVAQLEAALLAQQQHRQRQLQGFRHSGDSAAAADPAEQPHTEHQVLLLCAPLRAVCNVSCQSPYILTPLLGSWQNNAS